LKSPGPTKFSVPRKVKIDGVTVVASAAEVKSPVAVRYAFSNNPNMSLYNGAGLPAPPFRSDDWAPPAGVLVDNVTPEPATKDASAGADHE